MQEDLTQRLVLSFVEVHRDAETERRVLESGIRPINNLFPTGRTFVIEKILTVTASVGVCARPASQIVMIAYESQSKVSFTCRNDPGRKADGRSILHVLMLGAGIGTELVCCITGPDEVETMRKMENVFEGKFGME